MNLLNPIACNCLPFFYWWLVLFCWLLLLVCRIVALRKNNIKDNSNNFYYTKVSRSLALRRKVEELFSDNSSGCNINNITRLFCNIQKLFFVIFFFCFFHCCCMYFLDMKKLVNTLKYTQICMYTERGTSSLE